MDNMKGVLLILTILFVCTTFLFFLRSATSGVQLDEANKLSASTLVLLQTQGIPCSASPVDFKKITSCIGPALEIKNFKEDGFVQPDEKKGTQGYIVIKNVNVKPYDTQKLSLERNRAVVQEGCSNIAEGDIGKGVTCRFIFSERCEEGDVLEAYYTGNSTGTKTKIFMKTC